MNVLNTLMILASAEGGSEAGLFSGAFGEAVWTVLAFLILLGVLRKFAWNRVLEGLQARQDHIRGQLEAADGARQEAQEALDGVRQQSGQDPEEGR